MDDIKILRRSLRSYLRNPLEPHERARVVILYRELTKAKHVHEACLEASRRLSCRQRSSACR